ncbi:NAD(P)H-binding protein [Asticcacaulis sp. DXS10W]|uniref:NAD(P)H-binding protein n=1 Tax=Asticcacaulis currens TaxID=2984210 RepID=A0ABT5ICD3_9CAUL|nr:NAD(P)H-binding protein [Asticcacaulis currens]MDC7693505.1 NAD(P)H-binding protein [Asticcacaulis currens]
MRQTVFLTGATGNMGREVLKQLADTDDFEVRILVLPKEKSHPVIKRFSRHNRVRVVWGDLTRYEDVEKGVKGAGYVLHVGGMVSPLADRFPDLTHRVNVGGTANIVRAVKAQPDPDAIKLVYIGTVAETGSRNPPFHWGRTGDPIKISQFDHYAVSKAQAEAIVAESGLKHWVSLRQTGMAYPEIWKMSDPIMFHNPINGVFEWVSARDSGRLLTNICVSGVPDHFWRRFYNIGGGASCRVVNHEYMEKMFAVMGIADYRNVLSPHWFATQNFHGQWYSDSDELERLVPFRRDTIEDILAAISENVPVAVKLASRLFPRAISKRIEAMAKAEGGSLRWFADNDVEHINAYFGSREVCDRLARTWEGFDYVQPSKSPTTLDHGYDESRTPVDWDLALLKDAARFRGGKCLSDDLRGPYSVAAWQCSRGHTFTMTPNLYLKGGHWCPTCMINTDVYPEVVASNPFFGQVACG